jgi:hypothetical protein
MHPDLSVRTSEEGAESSPPLPASVEDAVPDWLVAATQSAPTSAPTRLATWRHVVAALVYDSLHHRQFAGARSVLIPQRRLLFEADGIGIDLEVDQSRIAGRLRMLGQIVAGAPDLTQAWVITEGASGRLESEVDELGQFSFDALVSGVHRLEIGLAYELIEIPSIQF